MVGALQNALEIIYGVRVYGQAKALRQAHRSRAFRRHQRYWHDAKGMVQPMTVHARSWLEDMPFGKDAALLWRRGFGFDYISDRQLVAAKFADGNIATDGGSYRAIVVPACEHIPLATLEHLRELADAEWATTSITTQAE